MRAAIASLVSLASLVGTAGLAAAEPAEPNLVTAASPQEAPYAVGFRIGGYGFRHDDATNAQWNDCRMNGIGLFAQRSLRGPLFAEVGLDTYFSTGEIAPGDLPIDRENVLVSAAVGARTAFTSWLRGYVQLGTGVELARVSVPYADSKISADKLLPEGFIGVGGDIRIARATYVGATMRMLVMGNFDYDPTRLQMSNQWIAAPPASAVFAASPSLAAQGQFFIRRDL